MAAAPPPDRGGGGFAAPAPGLGAEGTGGFPGIFGGGFAAIGGTGFGFAAIGGGGFEPTVLGGLEDPFESETADGVFFQGVADPFAAAIPGNTETGFADASAATDFGTAALTAAGAGAGGTALGARGGGGGGAGAAASFGTSSK